MATKASIAAQIAANLADNITGLITPLKHREVETSLLDYALKDQILIEDSVLTITTDATELTGIICKNRPQVQNIDAPDVTDITFDIDITNSPGLVDVSAPSLTDVGGYVTISDYGFTIDLTALQTVGKTISINNHNDLTDIILSALISTGGAIDLSANTSVEEIDLSSLTTIGGTDKALSANNNTALVTATLNNAIDALIINFEACALDVTSVDGILAAVDAAGFSNGTLSLHNGTSASPTGGATNANYLSLIGKGWTVNIN